jgi:DNA-binding MarR family transcriptional regulator
MRVELDDEEQDILTCLTDRPGIGFNELLRELGSRGLRISRSGLSRRLKRLVRLRLVTKRTTPGWPPLTRYTPPSQPPTLPTRILAMGQRNPIGVLLGLSLLAMIAVISLQTDSLGDLETELNAKNQLLHEKLALLEEADSQREAQEKLLEEKEDQHQRMADLLILVSEGKAEVRRVNTSQGRGDLFWVLFKYDTR